MSLEVSSARAREPERAMMWAGLIRAYGKRKRRIEKDGRVGELSVCTYQRGK